MPVFTQMNGIWKDCANQYANINGVWRTSLNVKNVHINGVWRECLKTPEIWNYHTAFLGNGSFVVPTNGWYRFIAIGKSGNGSGAMRLYGGGGGGSGALAVSDIYLFAGTIILITVNNTISIATGGGIHIEATAGRSPSTWYTPDEQLGGTAVGGNFINCNGFQGGACGHSRGIQGGNNGMRGGWGYDDSKYYEAGWPGGGGGALPGNGVIKYIATNMSNYWAGDGGDPWSTTSGENSQSLPAVAVGANMLLYGGGGGGGSGCMEYDDGSYRHGGNGSAGSPGAVIIEQAVK